MSTTVTAPAQSAVAAKPLAWRWLVAGVLSCVVIVGFFDRISVAVLFTNADFGAAMGTGFNPVLMGTLMTAFLLPYAFSALFLSFTGDVFSPRRLLMAVASTWGALMLAMGAATSYGFMFACRFLLGVAEGPQFSWIQKILRRWFPPHEYGRASSIWSLGSPLGAAIGFPLLIYLVATFGWRSAFYIVGLLNLLIVVPLLWTVVRDWPHNVSEQTVKKDKRSFGEVLRDSRIFLTDWRFWALAVSDCGALMYLWGLSSWLPTYLQRERHFDLQHLGIYSSLPFILSVCGQVLTGIVIDRTDRAGWLCFVGCFMAGVFIYLGANASEATTAAILIACSGGCFGMWAIAVYVLMRKVIPESAFAAGAGTINGIANAAGSTAPVIVGFVISLTGSFSSGLLVIVIAPILGSLPLLALMRRY